MFFIFRSSGILNNKKRFGGKNMSETRKIELMYVIPTLSTGGAEKLVVELTNNINLEIFNITLVSLYNQQDHMHTYDYLMNKNIKMYFLNKKIGLDFKIFSRLKKIVKIVNPDIIHAHLDTLLYLIPSFNKRQKKFFTIHNVPDKEAQGLQMVIRKYCFKFKQVVPIAISNQIEELTRKYYKLKNKKIPTIYNGIYLSDKTKIIKENNKKFIIINVSSFKPAKDHITLLKVYNEFHKKHKNSELWLLGDGSLKGEILDYIDKNDIVGVNLFGNVSNVYDYLLKADMFLLTSIYEGLPLCLLEALSVGLPIVSTNVGGIPDIIKNDYNGLLVDSGDIDKMLDKCELLFNNIELQKQLSINAINSSKLYDIRLCAKKHEELYLDKTDKNM